eukprot:CAMPEP_0181467530 /NCGR_PEP_ID=MMETSP1110-20121109/37028_1 /TAXON_ID=174948 /ORGANISM="Symbiodinium sp., Strain CCMP421" /LENGTH=96 /DNA_ID=CAMNT_0023592363 /DNA_START=235 /DNA_END=522 /DNA_ORIENTATION=-
MTESLMAFSQCTCCVFVSTTSKDDSAGGAGAQTRVEACRKETPPPRESEHTEDGEDGEEMLRLSSAERPQAKLCKSIGRKPMAFTAQAMRLVRYQR